MIPFRIRKAFLLLSLFNHGNLRTQHEDRLFILRTVQTSSGKPLRIGRAKYDPDNCPITDFKPPNRLIRLCLPECLKTVGDKAGPLTVLKPLIFRDKKKLPEIVPKWKNEIDSLKLSESTNKTLIELLENAILSRFPEMTFKEIQKMIRITPLDKTVAGQELIQMGINEGILKGFEKGRLEGLEKGRIEGIEKGEIIGKIHLAQRLLKRRITPKKKLVEQSPKELKAILKKLEAELRIV